VPLLTLTTDFGLTDPYVAAMKGVILSIAPGVRMVDVTHGVGAQDVMGAAFVLRGAVPFFPEGTVHLAVVDPGVGSERRPIAARIGGQVFVGPDNGLFSLLLGAEPEAEPEAVVVLDRPAFWRTAEPSRTFHGRDIFAPVAAHLAAGRALDEVGSRAERLKRLHWVRPLADEQGLRGWVVHLDHFGNAVTNIPGALLAAHRDGRGVKCYVGSTILEGVHHAYSDVAEGEPLALVGSSGHLEVSVNGGDAARLLSIQKGSPVNIVSVERG
jgi:S-adenosyl-L-methionine hydrolase (adenosine-forming)